MNEQNRNASKRLLSRFSWEFVLLVLLTLSVLGVAFRAPLKTFPLLAAQLHPVNDPYDLRADRVATDARTHVETGL